MRNRLVISAEPENLIRLYSKIGFEYNEKRRQKANYATQYLILKQRLVKYKKYINEAEEFIKKTLIPNLRVWNDKQRKKNIKLSIGFYISTSAYDQINKVFSVLSYSNIINIDYSNCERTIRESARKYGQVCKSGVLE